MTKIQTDTFICVDISHLKNQYIFYYLKVLINPSANHNIVPKYA